MWNKIYTHFHFDGKTKTKIKIFNGLRKASLLVTGPNKIITSRPGPISIKHELTKGIYILTFDLI